MKILRCSLLWETWVQSTIKLTLKKPLFFFFYFYFIFRSFFVTHNHGFRLKHPYPRQEVWGVQIDRSVTDGTWRDMSGDGPLSRHPPSSAKCHCHRVDWSPKNRLAQTKFVPHERTWHFEITNLIIYTHIEKKGILPRTVLDLPQIGRFMMECKYQFCLLEVYAHTRGREKSETYGLWLEEG